MPNRKRGPPEECLVANRRLRDLQQETLEGPGIQLEAVAEGAAVDGPDEHFDRLHLSIELDWFLGVGGEREPATVLSSFATGL